MSEDHSSLSARVFHAIREDILNGKYQANEELKEKSIGEELGVSRTPVREALRQLELEGLVHIIPNKGAFVEGITLKDVKDIYEIRALLEGLCARWAAENITQEQIEELEENVFLSDFHFAFHQPLISLFFISQNLHKCLHFILNPLSMKNSVSSCITSRRHLHAKPKCLSHIFFCCLNNWS